jgi:AraC family transcriptional regulator, chitin signaling transcriptional activator
MSNGTLIMQSPQQLLRLFLILVGVSFSFESGGQSLLAKIDSTHFRGIPRVVHYTKKEFNGDPQFWTMCQDKDGVLYFGNNDGALIFDGERWQKLSLPNNSSIRCLKISNEGVIYAGGFNEFGTIKRDEFGKYYYESLTKFLRVEDRNFENIWQIHEVEGNIVFRSFRLLIAFVKGKALTLPASGNFDYSTVVHNQLYIQDDEGLKHLDLRSLEFKLLFNRTDFNKEDLVNLLPGFNSNDFVILTKQGSVFHIDSSKHKTAFAEKLIPKQTNNLITCAIQSSSGRYYIGTLSSQVLSMEKIGNQLVISKAFPTLQDNTVLGLFESNEGNIWALLNNGIDCITTSSPMSLLFENASVYDALPDGNNLYMATNQGVFISVFNEETRIKGVNFQNINGLEGQAWSLQRFENQILCSHDRGLFTVSNNKVSKLPGIKGVWKVIEVKNKPGYYLACTYDGLFLLAYNKDTGFQIKHRLEGFNESSRDILQSDEPGVFWICHGYKGVFKIKIEETFKRVVSLEHFKDQNGLPSPFNVNVFKWNNQTLFTTNQGIFIYDQSKNRFVPHEFLTTLFGTTENVRKLFQYGDKTWFVHDDEIGYFLTSDKNPKLEKGLFLQLKGTFNPSMECIVPLNARYILIGTNTGLYSFDLAYDAGVKKSRTLITRVSYSESSKEIVSPLTQGDESRLKLPYNASSIIFNFSAPGFLEKNNVQYSYKIDGVDDAWSPWQEASVKEFTIFRAGHYVFHVKARSLLGEESDEAIYKFEIMPVWYKTIWAIIIYCIIGAVLIFLIAMLVKKKIQQEKEKTQAEEKEKRKVLELIIQRIKLEREKEQIMKDKDLLEGDVIQKSKELANYTMLLVKKRELLTDMHEELKELKDLVRNDASRQKLRDLIKRINTNLQDEEHIKVFEANFERVHHEFFTELKAFFPDLTQKELRLCAFVRMNLTNKEIASILNISVRGVETARYRLRKRLSLNHEEDMAEFLEKLYSSNNTPPQEEPQGNVSGHEEGV